MQVLLGASVACKLISQPSDRRAEVYAGCIETVLPRGESLSVYNLYHTRVNIRK